MHPVVFISANYHADPVAWCKLVVTTMLGKLMLLHVLYADLAGASGLIVRLNGRAAIILTQTTIS
jgi:hypothetical protein